MYLTTLSVPLNVDCESGTYIFHINWYNKNKHTFRSSNIKRYFSNKVKTSY